ncbi:hypothetical protein HU200_065905 [Digitaria exilis]|uniref:Ureide permease n=1 Tax=Digitaria exilis TaxID=1010633 RepID=A0A835DUA4_9POAL|nr:hypothetical protein HU200_065905 [Digitaria exilis]
MPVLVEDRGGTVALLLVSLFFHGTWPALITLLERRGRLPQHTYLDYSITNLLAAVIMALVLGQAGESTNGTAKFFSQLAQDNWPSVLFAMAGGIALGLANLLLQYSIPFLGLSVATVILTCLGMVVADPAELEISQAKVGTAEFIIQVEERRSIKVFGSDKWLGIGLVFLTAVCASLSFVGSNLGTNDQWHTLSNGTPHLVVYTVFFYFTVSCFVLEVCLNVWFLYQPRAGVPASTIGAYTMDWKGRNWALVAGLLCGFGNGLKLMGAQAAGYAASDAVLVPFSALN